MLTRAFFFLDQRGLFFDRFLFVLKPGDDAPFSLRRLVRIATCCLRAARRAAKVLSSPLMICWIFGSDCLSSNSFGNSIVAQIVAFGGETRLLGGQRIGFVFQQCEVDAGLRVVELKQKLARQNRLPVMDEDRPHDAAFEMLDRSCDAIPPR